MSHCAEVHLKHAYYKIVKHAITNEVEVRRWWEVACINGCACVSRDQNCNFQHYQSAQEWITFAECHPRCEADRIAMAATVKRRHESQNESEIDHEARKKLRAHTSELVHK